MKKQKLGDLVKFVPGINPTRAKKQYGIDKISYYDQASFEQDHDHVGDFIADEISENVPGELTVQKGDVVISNSLQLAAMVGSSNEGKVPSLNFTKIEFIDDILDKHYFIYLFNAYRDVKRQKERKLQGNGLSLRIPIKSLNQIEIPVVELEKQVKIGQAYIEMLKLQAKLNTYGKLVEELTKQALEKNLKGDDSK